jgi:type VI secretion system protein VasD
LGLILLLAGLLAGCGGGSSSVQAPAETGPPAPVPTTLVLDIETSPQLNLNTDGTAAPLLVRIYELADSGRFANSGFFQLLDDDGAVLGTDLMGRDEIRFTPGETRIIPMDLGKKTTAVGIFAAYRSTDGQRWRDTIDIIQEMDHRANLMLGARELTLTQGAP